MANKFNAPPMKLIMQPHDTNVALALLSASIKGDLHAIEIERMDKSDIEVHQLKLSNSGIHGSRKQETYTCEVPLDAGVTLKLMYVLMDGDLQQQHMALKQDKIIFHAAMSRDKRWTVVPNNNFAIW
jgi:hypothetical protein